MFSIGSVNTWLDKTRCWESWNWNHILNYVSICSCLQVSDFALSVFPAVSPSSTHCNIANQKIYLSLLVHTGREKLIRSSWKKFIWERRWTRLYYPWGFFCWVWCRIFFFQNRRIHYNSKRGRYFSISCKNKTIIGRRIYRWNR